MALFETFVGDCKQQQVWGRDKGQTDSPFQVLKMKLPCGIWFLNQAHVLHNSTAHTRENFPQASLLLPELNLNVLLLRKWKIDDLETKMQEALPCPTFVRKTVRFHALCAAITPFLINTYSWAKNVNFYTKTEIYMPSMYSINQKMTVFVDDFLFLGS